MFIELRVQEGVVTVIQRPNTGGDMPKTKGDDRLETREVSA